MPCRHTCSLAFVYLEIALLEKLWASMYLERNTYRSIVKNESDDVGCKVMREYLITKKFEKAT